MKYLDYLMGMAPIMFGVLLIFMAATDIAPTRLTLACAGVLILWEGLEQAVMGSRREAKR